VGLIARFRKGRAIRRYLDVCSLALIARYGAEDHYSPARVVATLKAVGLELEHREYACAMFARTQEFVEWARREAAAVTFVKPSDEKLRERYAALREEVAEKHNGGSHAFLPKGGDSYDSVSPARGRTGIPSIDAASNFRWYR